MEVLTQDGFQEFSGLLKQGVSSSLYRITLDNGNTIRATGDHQFLLDDKETFISTYFLEIGDILYPNYTVVSIDEIPNEPVYDLAKVSQTQSYYTNGIISHNCSMIYLDEFAFVENANQFYTSTYPVIASGTQTKVVITSTANGIGNPFHRLWEGAVQGTNEFKPFRVDWWDVPGRDEEWKQKTIRNTSETQFAQEFSNDFLGTGNTLVNSNALLKLKASEPVYENNGVRIFKEPEKDHNYIMTVDVCKGRGQDYSAFSIIDVSVDPYEQVAAYNDNLISPLLYPTIIHKFALLFNNAYVVVENNDQGMVVCNGLYYDIEYENVFVSSAHKADGIGVYMDKKVKRNGCSNLKDLVEQNRLNVLDKYTIEELTTFVAKGQSFEAATGNYDDLVMTLVLFAWFSTTSFFGELTDDNVKSMLFQEKMKQIEDELTPFGIIDDGQNNEEDTSFIDGSGQRWTVDEETGLGYGDVNDSIFSGWPRRW